MIQTFLILSLVAGLASSLTCPDGHKCTDDQTCCKGKTGSYSCCPLPNAVCCSDMLHCCPENTTCDLVHSLCTGLTTVPWMEKIPATHTGTTLWEETESTPLVQAGTANAVTENVCPDNTECPPEYSCMPTSKGTYGCCPLTGATICKDLEHCCPKGYKCDLGKAKCKRTGFEELPLVSGVGNLRTAESELCGNMSCSEGYTCCTSNDFGWGCCPMKNAVCCDNQCCPKGFQCDKTRKTCIKPIDENVKAIICPDGKSECPNGSTCCLLRSEQWGCCPLEKAVCCEDHQHCCPTDTRCDVKHSKCLSEYGVMEMWKKFPARRRFAMKNTGVHVVKCNETVACPDNNTCCILASGDYGCCPLPNAVCCSDHVHCCPHGSICSPDTGACHQKDISIPWMTKSPALVKEIATYVKCSCQSDQTCCKNPLGEWGCCPLPAGVCCSDNIHCCPNGYACDVQAGLCYKGSISVPLLTKIPSILKDGALDIQCDETVKCQSGSTCCKLASGLWACCPLPQAVCCEDHKHCCPNGYTCNLTAKTCEKQSILALRHVEESLSSDVQCDAMVQCPSPATCCKSASGKWACCPYKEATCCEDKMHCCPNGYMCNKGAKVCTLQPRLRWDQLFLKRKRIFNIL
ncbi:progranulin-like isoform X1 [Mobula hypostoma]|uniref:progranulin-like isoform X1 n=1 Tax=Mobula hypostoma TaxID=723540 RepID=UPI002FC2FE70